VNHPDILRTHPRRRSFPTLPPPTGTVTVTIADGGQRPDEWGTVQPEQSLSDRLIYDGLMWLNGEMVSIESQRDRLPVDEVRPNDAELAEFLEEESRLD